MGGHDPYSSSKGCAELVIAAYKKSYFLDKSTANIASARAGNVIGGGDWSEDRLIPDILRSFEKGTSVIIRNPLSVRPWQHVLEPVSGYLVLAQALFEEQGETLAEGWNFGPRDEDCKSVEWILNKMVNKWGAGASWEKDKNNNPHEAEFLKLDISKAKRHLKWQPKWELEHTLNLIIDWHRSYLNGDRMQDKCLDEIKTYMKTNRK